MASPEYFMTGEPRKVFVNKLIVNLQRIHDMIYVFNRPMISIRLIRGVLALLDKESQEKLEDYRKELNRFENQTGSVQRDDLERVFREVSKALHVSYLSGAGVKPYNPKPKHITNEEPKK